MTSTQPTHWLFLRGLARESGHWQGFIDDCQSQLGWHCQGLDLPGFGSEYRRPSPLSIAEIRRDLQQRLALPTSQALGIVAMSLGGMVALDWLAAEPERIHRAVLINTSSSANPPWQRLQPSALPWLLRALCAQQATQQERASLNMVSNRRAEDVELLKLHCALRAAHPARKRNVLRQLWAASRFRCPRALHYPQRLTLLASRGDRMVSWHCSAALAKKLEAPLSLHPSAGHDLVLDDPDWLLRQFSAL